MKELSSAKIILFILFALYSPKALSGSYSGPDLHDRGIRLSYEAVKPKSLQRFDVSALNLKDIKPQNSVVQTNTAISIELSDFNTISTPGNTWLQYQKLINGISMNIGVANSTSPQSWTLPASLFVNLKNPGRNDFIALNEVPSGLEISGANKVMRTYYFDNNDRILKEYQHFFIDNNAIQHLGTSYDLEVGDDDVFDEPDYEYADVPLDLGDSWAVDIEEQDYVTNLTLTKYIRNITVDAFGTISTPNGDFNCLRMITVIQEFTRPDENTAYTLIGTRNEVGFITKEGLFFKAGASATSGVANLTYMDYRIIVPTAILSENTDVVLNNDSKGVTINTDNDTAHPSAILDIKDDNLGILIPRIAKANRPAVPAVGLLIYQIDNTPGFYYFDGSGWRILGSSPATSAQTTSSLDYRPEDTTPLTERSRGQGIAQLKNGTTFINFDRNIENPEDLNINLTLEGDCNGLYVSRKTKEGFEVKELQKGKSNVKFSYSIQEK
jgi:hypothetical protein